MATMAGPRKTISIYDYPEHLNPFREEDNHNKIRFWTIGRKLSRSNSITFSGIKDLKNSWALRSFMRKGKKQSPSSSETKPSQVNGESSPVVYRRAMQYSSSTMGPRNTVGSPDRYVYGGSVTPLPRSRFQERLKSTSQQDFSSPSATPRMARSDVMGSRLSVESTNPFDECPVPPVRASRRKKNRAPLPPPQGEKSADVSVVNSSLNETAELTIIEDNEKKEKSSINEKTVPNPIDTDDTKPIDDLDLDQSNLNIELRIIEDNEIQNKIDDKTESKVITNEITIEPADDLLSKGDKNKESEPIKEITASAESPVKNAESDEDIINKISFDKVDIAKYRRNSSVNDDDIRLRRGNLEDFHTLINKRSKSLTNTYDTSYVTYDINLNENISHNDINENDEPHKVICKLHKNLARKESTDTSTSSTEKEFIEIDKATRELEREISKLNSALSDEEIVSGKLTVSEIKRKFDNGNISPNPIPKPRRSFNEDKLITS